MTIRLDASPHTVVVSCSRCGVLPEGPFTDRLAAWVAGARHDDRVHPDSRQASDALSKLRQRLR